jgi:hypothetical protein
MTARLIFVNDEDPATTYELDRHTGGMPERDARIALALMEMVIDKWKNPRPFLVGGYFNGDPSTAEPGTWITPAADEGEAR